MSTSPTRWTSSGCASCWSATKPKEAEARRRKDPAASPGPHEVAAQKAVSRWRGERSAERIGRRRRRPRVALARGPRLILGWKSGLEGEAGALADDAEVRADGEQTDEAHQQGRDTERVAMESAREV